MASTNYINECKNDAYKNRLGKIEIAEKKVTTGTSIKIEKGADSAIDLTLYGKSTQATRSGKNLFTKQGNATPTTDTTFWDGITNTTPESDGWCKVSFDNTNGTTTLFANQFTKRNTIDKLEVNKTYSILVEVRNLTMSGSSSTPPYLQLCETAQNSVWQSAQNYDLAIFKETNKAVFQKLTKTNFDSSTMDFRNFVSVPKGHKVEFEYRLMVVKGSYTLDTIGEYEPYGVMPSPDYPSPIESVGRKNLFDKDNTTILQCYFDGSHTSLTSASTNTTTYCKVMPNTTYNVSKLRSIRSFIGTTQTLPDINTTVSNILNIGSGDYDGITRVNGTITTGENDNYIVINYSNTNTETGDIPNNILDSIQIEKGTVATDYVPYEHTEISATVTGKNLFDKDNCISGSYLSNLGQLLGSSAFNITEYIPVIPNAEYTISGITSSGSNPSYCFYDKGKNFISGETHKGYLGEKTITIPANCYYFRDSINNVDIDTYQFEKGIQATTYEQYKSNTLAIDLQGNELCSLPNGTKDEVNITNGEALLTKRIDKAILNGSESWRKAQIGTTGKYYFTFAPSWGQQTTNGKLLYCDYFVPSNTWSEQVVGMWLDTNMIIKTQGSLDNTEDLTSFKTWLSTHNVEVLYELAEPETINLGTVEMPYTYNGVSNIINSADTEMVVKAYEWTDEITNYDNLQSIQIDSGCYTDGNIIGSVYVECLNASFVAEATNLVDKIIRCQIGVKYADLSTEYICKGKYIIERPNNEITAQMSQITAYSDLYTNLEAIYICNLDYSAGNITLKDVYIDVCKQLGLTPLKTDFLNSTIPITDNPFKNNEKNRVVLQTVSKIACSFVNVYEDNNQIDLCWLSENTEPDYTFEMSDYVSVEGGQVICGPINCLIIKNSQIDDENVTIKDDESIKANGEHSITISDDYILHNAELRQQAITSIWNRVKGLKYVDCKLITYYGKPFLKLGNKIRVYTSDTDYFDTYVLKHKFEYDGAFASTIESPALTEQEIKTKQDISLGKALTNVQIDLDKQKERITSTVTTTNALQDSVSNLSETVQEQANQMQTLSTTLTQTNQSLQAEVNQINESLENGVSNLKNKLVTIDINGIAVSTNTSAIKAIMNNDRFAIKNGNTEAFYVGYDENLKKSVSRMNDLTITDYFTAGYHRQEKFEINGEQRTGWFYVGGE